MSNYEKLVQILKEIFQLDQADLDFGIYRIMNQKRDEIEKFLTKDLLPQVGKAFEKYSTHDKASIQNELDKTIENAKSMGVDPDTVPKVNELKSKYSLATDVSQLENEVFSLLANFFRRYYKEGDFISMRRYKKDVYAIPYEGEEVKLHWANHDQYYIKTSEYFKHYSFKLKDGKNVRFELIEAKTEQNNNIEQEGKERRFAIVDENPLLEEGKELKIFFTYEVNPEKQDTLTSSALETLIPIIPQSFYELLSKRPTEKNKNRTLLEKHIRDYTARNTFDYFIHKDLGDFLRRELDFYIKNEVLYIDDINTQDEAEFIKQLSKIKALKDVANKVISFLEQLENFQKKLWIKKKFVVEANYCITIDRIPKALYSEIVSNSNQVQEWINLYSIDEIKSGEKEQKQIFENNRKPFTVPLSIEFLEQNPYLILDTKYFSNRFKSKLLASISNIDKQLNGLLISSENFQALNLLSDRYREQIKAIYIDPPYNTNASEILYKNGYKNASWNGLIENRLNLSYNLLTNDSITCATIDDMELRNLNFIMTEQYGIENHQATVCIRNNPSGRSTVKGFAINHEYGLFYSKNNDNVKLGRLAHSEQQTGRYDEKDENGNLFEWENFRKNGTDSDRIDRPKQFYPFYYNTKSQVLRIPKMEFDETQKKWDILEKEEISETVLYPIDESGREKVWKFGEKRASQELGDFLVKKSEDSYKIYRRKYLNEAGSLPRTWWDNPKYSARDTGTRTIRNLFGVSTAFDFPKSVDAVADSVLICLSGKSGTTLDYFAGSGTTGHAIINLNREDNGYRKYILVEMGEYFDSVTKPRIKKVIYSKDWKDGKPVSRLGSSHCFKYIRLESYEETLNNLELKRDTEKQSAIDFSSQFKEDYLLSYMLDVESEGSASLLNINEFSNPFDYKLKVIRNNETQTVNVDLPETFNYLIGLVVETIDELQGFKVITGKNLKEEKILIIWRNIEEKDNKTLDDFFLKQQYNTRDSEFDRIYVNGDNNLENLKVGDEKWKVVLIEEEFKKRMFDVKEF